MSPVSFAVITFFVTVTTHALLTLPAVAVIVALPSLTPVTTPPATVATFSSDEDQVIVSEALAGVNVAMIDTVEPSSTEALTLSRATAVAATASVVAGAAVVASAEA